MKKISLWLLTLLFTSSLVFGQDTAAQQQIDKLAGQIQDLLDAQAQQNKRLDALEREISDLRDKVNAPVVTDYATHDELNKLKDALQEIDRKRKEDSDMIAKQIENLAKAAAVAPPSAPHHTSNTSKSSSDHSDLTSGTHYEYEIKQGDNLGLIVKAYRDHGVKVTKSQIIEANPKMNPNVLIPGEKIIIPDTSGK